MNSKKQLNSIILEGNLYEKIGLHYFNGCRFLNTILAVDYWNNSSVETSTNGSVGIGTSTNYTGYILDVRGNSAIGTTNDNLYPGLFLDYIDAGTGEFRFRGIRDGEIFKWGHASGGISWVPQMVLSNNVLRLYNSTTNEGNITVQLHPSGNTYFTGGNVGIGTNNPGRKLVIQNGANTWLSLVSTGTELNDVAGILFGDEEKDSEGQIRYDNTDNSMSFNTLGQEKMRIDSDGNVIIGSTSVYHTDSKLDVRGNTAIGATNDNLYPGLFLDYIDAGTGEFRFRGFRDGEIFKWGHASGGISWVPQMVLSNNVLRLYNCTTNEGNITVQLHPNGNSYFNGGNLCIGTTSSDVNARLTVAGKISAQDITIKANAGADFIFEKDYALPSLQHVEQFIQQNKHLPEIPSSQKMQENGVQVSEMQTKLLQKIEELTLYVIDMNKKIELQNNTISDLKNENQELKAIITSK